MKDPVIYYQHHPEKKYQDATNKRFADITKYNGLAHGLYGGDEARHGIILHRNPNCVRQ